MDNLLKGVDKSVMNSPPEKGPGCLLKSGGALPPRTGAVDFQRPPAGYQQGRSRGIYFLETGLIQISTSLITIILFTFFNPIMVI